METLLGEERVFTEIKNKQSLNLWLDENMLVVECMNQIVNCILTSDFKDHYISIHIVPCTYKSLLSLPSIL